VGDQENSLIEQLRSFGVSIEDLEALTGEAEAPVETVVEVVSAPETVASHEEPSAFEPLTRGLEPAPVAEDGALKADTEGLRQQVALFDANQARDGIVAEAKDAAAEIRANAVRLVSVKLQAAEEEIMAMRLKATEEVAQLRRETARVLAARLQEAADEASSLRETAREESRAFWESASREFSEARRRIAEMHEHMVQLLASVNDAVASVEEAASSVAALCDSHLKSDPGHEESR
jgi:hypothetical protein